MDKFQNKYRIPSARALWHSYDGGAYFVTVCTKNRRHFCGRIRENTMELSGIGQAIHDNLKNVHVHYPYAEIPLFVVMPNHFHAIVFIDGNDEIIYTPHCRDVACNVSDDSNVSDDLCNVSDDLRNVMNGDLCLVGDGDVARYVSTGRGVSISPKRGTLSTVIRGIKSAVTKFAHESNIDFVWQTRFHDRIIRNQDEMNRIADYIEKNVDNWLVDDFYSNE